MKLTKLFTFLSLTIFLFLTACSNEPNTELTRTQYQNTKSTFTSTPVLPTATSTPAPTATSTPIPTATSTPIPTATSTPVPTATSTPIPTATSTPIPTATSTPIPTATSTPVPTATSTPVPTATSTPVPTATPKKEAMVWIPRTGSKYHSKSSCSNMKNPSQVTQSEAVSRGYTPCKKCY